MRAAGDWVVRLVVLSAVFVRNSDGSNSPTERTRTSQILGKVAKESDIGAYVGETVSLPCTVNTTKCGPLHSVKWYKDATRVYVLSSHAGQGRAEKYTTERMTVEYNNQSSKDGAVLKIVSVEGEDEAIYKCEMTYLEVIENCDVVQIVKLKTLKKPSAVRIYRNEETTLLPNATVIDNMKEDDEIDLTCEATEGKPIPIVKWYNGTTEVTRATYTPTPTSGGMGNGMSKLQLTLTRGDLLARFECRVQSEALEEPIISWIQIDVHVRPTKMDLTGVQNHVVQGTNVKLDCSVHGARPAATVRWTNGSDPIIENDSEDSKQGCQISTRNKQERDGTFTTTSSLSFKASYWENGRTIYCYAENEVMKNNTEPEIHSSLIMDVRFPPVITVKPLVIIVNESTTVNNTSSVFLQCVYFANPQELKFAQWLKDGVPLDLSDDDKYVGGTLINPPLYIKNVTREDMGNYSCSLGNVIETKISEENIFLNVQYSPDVDVIISPPTPVKAADKRNVTLLCNVTSGNPSNLLKVRWFLDGELLKELPECNFTGLEEGEEATGDGGPLCGLDPSIMSLQTVDQRFAGNYTCQGETSAGWGPVSEPRELIVYYAPNATKLTYYPRTVIKGGSVTLECSVDSPGRPENITYLWYRGSHQMTEITTANYNIIGVRLESRSNFTCIAANEGGQSPPSTVYVNIYAPPSFINTLNSYQGILYSSKHINLTCIVECFPECAIVWLKDGVKLDIPNNPLYYVETHVLPPNLQKNDFEAINSTLIWNMTAWPEQSLDISASNSNYTCEAISNKFGPGVSKNIEIAIDYPPKDVIVLPKVVYVVENQVPSPIKCHGNGRPALNYLWRKNFTSAPFASTEDLVLGPLTRSDSGEYICEGKNKHGSETALAYINVQYAPECSITTGERDGNPALVCTVQANPSEVTFTWRVREQNDTFTETDDILDDGLKSFLLLDSGVDSFRTYLCYVNNSVGLGVPCERDVAGSLSWWKQLNQDKLVIIIASIIAVIIIVIIICIIIIILCRRRRADTKFNNPLEMEERENPEDESHNISSDPFKWPLQPGVLVHINKMNNVSISRPFSRAPFKTTSVSHVRAFSKYKRNRSKVYARLERLKKFLSLSSSRERIPNGIKESDRGVVTFRKVHVSSPTDRPKAIATRKRKKPGSAPNLSSIGDKPNLGVALPLGGTADPSIDPDKGFYENLPFHGMQNPPNKPISIIAPFKQGNIAHCFTSSTKALSSSIQAMPPDPYKSMSENARMIKRHQSFHGFQNNIASRQGFHESGLIGSNYMESRDMNFKFENQSLSHQSLPSIFSQLPHLRTISGAYTVSGIPLQNHGGIRRDQMPVFPKTNGSIALSSNQNRIVGRNESSYGIRRSASGINFDTRENISGVADRKEPKKKDKGVMHRKLNTIVEKRFGSLDIRKHKCYSPTFYSMRCKKHAKKRPIIVALPKKCFSELALSQNTDNDKVDNLTDSIQITEETKEQDQSDNNSLPVPAPRGSKLSPEIVYANFSKYLKETSPAVDATCLDSSSESADNKNSDASTIEVIVHAPREIVIENKEIGDSGNEDKSANDENHHAKDDNITMVGDNHKPKLVAASPKVIPTLSTHALKNSPILKVSPNFVKPKTESPKGALSLQIKSKIKTPPVQSPTNQEKTVSMTVEDEKSTTEQFSGVPKMPILTPSNKWNANIANNCQNAFYTLTAPHFKQLNTVVPPQYSATIPHQKHSKLMPRTLFQEQVQKSKSFSSKSKPKKHHFQIPLQKCHSFKYQTAESYFQPIKNLHEENLMRNGYASDYPEGSHRPRHQKRDRPKQKTRGPLVLRRPSDYQENVHFQENMQNSVQLQYPQPLLGCSMLDVANKPNGVVYADLDIPADSKRSCPDTGSSRSKSQNVKPKTEYATLKFDDVGQEIDV